MAFLYRIILTPLVTLHSLQIYPLFLSFACSIELKVNMLSLIIITVFAGAFTSFLSHFLRYRLGADSLASAAHLGADFAGPTRLSHRGMSLVTTAHDLKALTVLL